MKAHQQEVAAEYDTGPQDMLISFSERRTRAGEFFVERYQFRV